MTTNAQDTYLESRIFSADGVELIRMLYQAALNSVGEARQYLKQGDIAARSKAITKAYDIIIELSVSLDHSAGGELSRNLIELYSYTAVRLLEANINQSEPALAEVSRLLTTLLEGWTSCKATAPAKVEAPSPVSYPEAESGYGLPGGTSEYADEYESRGSMSAVSY